MQHQPIVGRQAVKEKRITESIFLLLTELYPMVKDGYVELPTSVTELCKKHKLDSRIMTVVTGTDGGSEYIKKVGKLYHWKTGAALPGPDICKSIYERVERLKTMEAANLSFRKLKPSMKPILRVIPPESDLDKYTRQTNLVWEKTKGDGFTPVGALVDSGELDKKLFAAMRSLRYLVESNKPALGGFFTWDSPKPDVDTVLLLMEQMENKGEAKPEKKEGTRDKKVQLILDTINATSARTMSRDEISNITGININTVNGIVYELNKNERLFKVSKSTFSTDRPVQELGVTVAPGEHGKASVNGVGEKHHKEIIEYINGRPNQTASNNDICEFLKLSSASVSYHLKRMVKLGKLYGHGKLYSTLKKIPVLQQPTNNTSIMEKKTKPDGDVLNVLMGQRDQLIKQREEIDQQRKDIDQQIRSFDSVISTMSHNTAPVNHTPEKKKYQHKPRPDAKPSGSNLQQRHDEVMDAARQVASISRDGRVRNKEIREYMVKKNMVTIRMFEKDPIRLTKEISRYLIDLTHDGQLSKVGTGTYTLNVIKA